MSAHTKRNTYGVPTSPARAGQTCSGATDRLLPRRPVSDRGCPGPARIVEGRPLFRRAYRWPGYGRPGCEVQRGRSVQRVDHNLSEVLALACLLSVPGTAWTEIEVESGWPAPEHWVGPDQRVYAIAQRGRHWLVLRVGANGGEVLAKRTGSGPRLLPFPEEARWAAEDAALGRASYWMPLAEVA